MRVVQGAGVRRVGHHFAEQGGGRGARLGRPARGEVEVGAAGDDDGVRLSCERGIEADVQARGDRDVAVEPDEDAVWVRGGRICPDGAEEWSAVLLRHILDDGAPGRAGLREGSHGPTAVCTIHPDVHCGPWEVVGPARACYALKPKARVRARVRAGILGRVSQDREDDVWSRSNIWEGFDLQIRGWWDSESRC